MVHSEHVMRIVDLLLGIPALPRQRLPRVLSAKCLREVAVQRVWRLGRRERRRNREREASCFPSLAFPGSSPPIP